MAQTSKAQPLPSDWSDDRRGSRHARGYGTEWDHTRARILKRDKYLCQCSTCKAKARVKPANEVDHIISKVQWRIENGTLDGVDDDSNLQAINHDCHILKTSEDRKAAYAATARGRGGVG